MTAVFLRWLACAESQGAAWCRAGARGLREAKHNIWRTNEVLFGGFLEQRSDKAKYDGMQEGGVKESRGIEVTRKGRC